jgi:signal transduction histidine kinase/DNA-binding response OmpR family regulator
MSDIGKISILVVDDLREKLLAHEAILEDLGLDIVTAQSGADALKHVLQKDFAVILLDVHMPGIDGFETASLIRGRRSSAHTPIIFLTAFPDEVRLIQGYAHGGVDYILLPVVPDVLRAKVKVFAELYKMQQQVKRQADQRVILAEERAKRAAAEEANRCSTFLAEASRVLSNSLDLDTTLRGLARQVVPFLGDLSVVCLAPEYNLSNRIVGAWGDADYGSLVQDLADLSCLPSSVSAAINRVLASGEVELLSPLDGDSPPDGPACDNRALPEFRLRSAVILPLAARCKTLGALALATASSDPLPYGPARIGLAEDLAYRASIAIENSLLVRDIQSADRRKDEFLAMLAHELRNPLAPIKNAVELLRQVGPADSALGSARDMIDRQLRHLSRLVDDLLDVSRITEGKIQLQLEAVDVVNVVASAVEVSQPAMEGRQHELVLSLPEEAVHVRADPARLSQILSNLLNNAAKYTAPGGRIWLSVAREGSQAVFRVRDSGVGIRPELLPRIFDLFTQGDQPLDRSQGGLGIGLTLVRSLVEMHGGTVEEFSQGPGWGSEFFVRLPAIAVPDAEPQKTEFGTDLTTMHIPGIKRRVLVVDDNIDAAESLAMLLRLKGHEVHTAHDGLTAVEAALTLRPEVVLLDLGLPGLDGFEVARRLRNHADSFPFLLAAITGYGQEKDLIRSQEAGFDKHLVKPIDPEFLCELLATWRHAADKRACLAS